MESINSSRSDYMGIHGPLHEYNDDSAMCRMRQQYWTTKQAVFRKLGKKEDDCIIASDLELDLKLELFQTIEESFLTLMRILENYQDRLCLLAQEENSLGRFLKEHGKLDKTRAGGVMSAAGKALSYTAQQRLTLRIPLVRLYQEVETFQYRAIVDTFETVEKMEKARTTYRGSLMWMKDVSQQLDPDTYKQMEKFRKVQSQVRKSKAYFDSLKLDTLQKVDLLSFSRCNLFSQALASYQNALLVVSSKIANTSTSVATVMKGYQHYEFSILKELTQTSKQLAEESSEMKSIPVDDKDTITFFEAEYHDDAEHNLTKGNSSVPKDSSKSQNLSKKALHYSEKVRKKKEEPENLQSKVADDLLELDENTNSEPIKVMSQNSLSTTEKINATNALNNGVTVDNESTMSDNLILLNEIMNAPIDNLQMSSEFSSDFITEWQCIFNNDEINPMGESVVNGSVKEDNDVVSGYLPSQLLDMNAGLKDFKTNLNGQLVKDVWNKNSPNSNTCKDSVSAGKFTKGKQDMSAWFSLFADLDPLSNPDMIGKKNDTFDDRNC